MISYLKEPHKKEDLLSLLHPFVKEWFFSTFKEFSLPQLYGVLEIHNKNNILISAPTGSTKTLTATLSIINELVTLADKNQLKDQVYCIYTNPLRALSRDVEINLKKPLQEIKQIAKKHNKVLDIRIASRTSDTSTSEKAKMLKKPPHILICTPETLSIILTTIKFRELLKYTQYVIVDEIHALAENKRGTHLSLSLERLQYLTNFTRIGLSATISPLEEIAQFLTGDRKCKIANINFLKQYDLKVLSPLPDLIDTDYETLHNSLYSLIDSLIQEHKTTLIFTNTRSATERVVHYLKEKFPKNYTENIDAHHGSLSKKHRHNVEDRLRQGKLKCVVCSTSLELGIDIGYIDLVICLGSPKSIARFLQRSGRSGHQLHEKVKARIIVLDRDDLIECSVLLKSAIEKKIDKIHIPKNALDVLAQQIHGIAISQQINTNDLYKLITSAYPYKNLTKEDFIQVIDYLSGKYISLEDRHIYAKIWYDEETGFIGKKGKLSRMIHLTNIGTIPDETRVLVKVRDEIIGTIDEAFLEKLRPGDVFILGGQRYIFKYSSGMTAQVTPTSDKPPTVPSWFSEMLPLSFELALEIQKFRKYMEEQFQQKKSKEEILDFINSYLYLDQNAANSIYEYFKEQFKFAEIPHEKKLLIEFYKEYNKNYVIFHSLYGRRVNDVLSRTIAYTISKIQHKDVEIGINDNGFYIASRDNKKIQVLRAFSLLKSSELEQIAEKAIEKSEVLKRRFRHCATRSLMILRQYKGKKKGVGRQQVSSMILLNAVKRISENFPILKEARREVLQDLMDIENAAKILKDIENKKIKIKQISTSLPSPFSLNLISQGYTDALRIEDKIEFLRKMHKQILNEIK